jgi:hypothetical protein
MFMKDLAPVCGHRDWHRLDLRFCVTGRIAVGTPRDGQDTTGRESIIAAIRRDVRTLRGNLRIRRSGRSVFQDHRHRPLGHPSASKLRLNSPESFTRAADNDHVSPAV